MVKLHRYAHTYTYRGGFTVPVCGRGHLEEMQGWAPTGGQPTVQELQYDPAPRLLFPVHTHAHLATDFK